MEDIKTVAITSSKVEESIGKALKEAYEPYYFVYNLGIATGGSISHILRLKVKDLYNQTTIFFPKKRQSEQADDIAGHLKVIPKALFEELNKYLLDKNPNSFAFPSYRDASKPMAYTAFQAALNNACVRANVPHISLNSLRKTYYYHQYLSDGSIEEVAKALKLHPEEAFDFLGLNTKGRPMRKDPDLGVKSLQKKVAESAFHFNALSDYILKMLKDPNLSMEFNSETAHFIEAFDSLCLSFEKNTNIPLFAIMAASQPKNPDKTE